MKIGLFAPYWPPGMGANGIVTYLSYLVPMLRQLGHEVFVLSYMVGENDRHTIDLRNYASSSPSLLNRVMFKLAPEGTLFKTLSSAIGRAIGDLVSRHQIDVLEMEESFGWSLTVSRLKLLPVLVRLHGPWFLNGKFNNSSDESIEHFRRLKREGKAIEHAEYVTAPSAEVLRAVKDYYKLTLSASQVIGNPIDAAAESDTWNINSCDRNTVLFVGRFDARKGGELALRAVAELAAIRPEVRLIFIGPDDGIKGTGERKWSLENYVKNALPDWFQSRIQFRGQMSHADVMSIRAKCFATIIASQYEIAPYSVLEAMSLGCPIVATSVGGIPELIKNRHNGLLVPSNNVEAMTAAIHNLLDDHGCAVQIGRQAWLDCRNIYRPEGIAKRTVTAYQQAIDTFKSS